MRTDRQKSGVPRCTTSISIGDDYTILFSPKAASFDNTTTALVQRMSSSLVWKGKSYEYERYLDDNDSSNDSSNSSIDDIDLCLDQKFLRGLFSLSTRAMDQVLSSLKREPIYAVTIQNMNGAWTKSRLEKGRRLCEALGTISTLKSMVICPEDAPWNKLEKLALQYINQVTFLKIQYGHWYDEEGGDATQIYELELSEADFCLLEHSTIKEATLDEVPNEYFTFYLPLLRAAPMLVSVTLDSLEDGDRELGAASGEAIADLLTWDKPELKVNIQGISFGSHCAASLRDAIARSNLEALNLGCCRFEDGEALGYALTRSHIQEINLCEMSFSGCVSIFLNACAAGLKNMTQLQKFCHSVGFKHYLIVHNKTEYDAAVVKVVRALLCCPQLTTLELESFSYSPELDEALANCVQSCRYMRECSLLQCIHYDQPFEARAVPEYPLFLEAMAKTYSLQQVELAGASLVTKERIEMYIQLNEAGRGYMAVDGSNHKKAMRVLGRVNQNLNCLFTHLRENPSICKVRIVKARASRKRRNESASVRS
ncbi:hypothetical protein MPSEU_000868200 [Mayamaea pseudoterrestris]|nr:hypothetical protein MPSEU_000868200 [Mayamaea pseudoterrestris]